MKKMMKLAALSMMAVSALTVSASADSFGFSFGSRGYSAGVSVSSSNYYSNYGYGQAAYSAPAYARYTTHEQSHVVYRPVTEARTYYVQRQQAYVARPIVQQVVSQQGSVGPVR